MEQGAAIAGNLRNLYLYMLDRLTFANLHNDVSAVTEVVGLVQQIKSGWDPIVNSR